MATEDVSRGPGVAADAEDAESLKWLFKVHTDIGTNLIVLVSCLETVAYLQEQIAAKHLETYPEHGELSVPHVQCILEGEQFRVAPSYRIQQALVDQRTILAGTKPATNAVRPSITEGGGGGRSDNKGSDQPDSAARASSPKQPAKRSRAKKEPQPQSNVAGKPAGVVVALANGGQASGVPGGGTSHSGGGAVLPVMTPDLSKPDGDGAVSLPTVGTVAVAVTGSLQESATVRGTLEQARGKGPKGRQEGPKRSVPPLAALPTTVVERQSELPGGAPEGGSAEMPASGEVATLEAEPGVGSREKAKKAKKAPKAAADVAVEGASGPLPEIDPLHQEGAQEGGEMEKPKRSRGKNRSRKGPNQSMPADTEMPAPADPEMPAPVDTGMPAPADVEMPAPPAKEKKEKKKKARED